MSFYFNGTQANVTITNIGMPQPNTSQTLVRGTCLNQAAASTTLITVTAGKTFYCTGATISCGGASSSMHLDVDGTPVLQTVLAINGNLTFSGGILFSCPATKTVTITSDQAGKTSNVWGYEA